MRQRQRIEDCDERAILVKGNVSSMKRTLGDDGWMEIDKG